MQYNETLPAAEVKRGAALAEKRAVVLEKLISADPQTALKHAVPVVVRNRMPAVVATHLEKRIQGHGEYSVIIATPESRERPTINRTLAINNKTYRANVYGRRAQLTSKKSIPVHGIAINGSMAVHESPVRLLEPGETLDASVSFANAGGKCPVSGKPVAANIIAVAGSRAYYLCSGGHIIELENQLAGDESGTNPDEGGEIAQSA